MSSDTIKLIFGLTGGLALFVFGMNYMGDGLQKAAGEKMRHILEVLTKNSLLAVLVGALVTGIWQSSGATTVLVVGFVSARLMTLPQAIGVIMGANIGTTITAQLVAFNIGDYVYPIAFIGFVLYFFFKKKIIKYIGQTIFAFGVLFIGLEIMSDTMKPLASNQSFINMMMDLGEIPVLGVLIGTVMTVLIQSSSALIAVVQNVASQTRPDGNSLISLSTAIPILLGSNIGTTIVAVIAAIGARVNAKRAALAHVMFNILGTVIFIFFVPQYAQFIEFITEKLAFSGSISRQIANSHTFFNILNTLIWLPFVSILAKLVTNIIRGEDTDMVRRVMYINDKMLKSPSIAMDLATNELTRMAGMTSQMMLSAKNSFIENNLKEIEKVDDIEDIVDHLKNEITNYLSNIISQSTLTERQSVRLAGLMHITHDIERIGDHCQNISEGADIKIRDRYTFSDQAIREIKEAFRLNSEMVESAASALSENNVDLARKVIAQEDEMDKMEMALRDSHMTRLDSGICNPASTVLFLELIHNFERIADHCKNIGEAILEDNRVEEIEEVINEGKAEGEGNGEGKNES